MAKSDQYSIASVDLTDGYYEIEQSLVRNKYTLTDHAGDVVLRGKQEMFNLTDEFPFVTAEDEEAFTVKANGMVDIAGSYRLVDSTTDEEVVVLDEELSLFAEHWTIRDPETGDEIATIRSKNKLLSALRQLSSIATIVPNEYDIRTPQEKKIGEISGQLSLKDAYEVTIDNSSSVPTEAVMASACVLDALANN